MEKEDLFKLTDEELLIEKKKYRKGQLFNAVAIGFLAGILIFGFGAWALSSDKKPGFLIPMIFPIIFIYRLVKAPNKNTALKEVLRESNLI